MIPLAMKSTLVVATLATVTAIAHLESTPLERAEEAMFAGEWEAARTALSEAKSAEGVDLAYIAYLEATAWLRGGDPTAALNLYTDLAERFPQSPWGLRATSARAEAYVVQKGYADAARALREGLDRLASPERRLELARTYITILDELSARENPDHAAIVELVTRARELSALDENEDLSLLKRGIEHCLRSNALLSRGIELANAYLDRQDTVEVRLLRGKLRARQGQIWAALQDFEHIATTSPASDHSAKALRGAAHLFGTTTTSGNEVRLDSCPSLENLRQATRLLQRLIADNPEHEEGVRARFELAAIRSTYPALRQAAIQAWSAFAQDFPEHPWTPAARLGAARALQAADRSDQAHAILQTFLEKHPTDSRWSGVLEQVKVLHLQNAQRLVEDGKWVEAREAWTSYVGSYPQDHRAGDSAWQIGHTYEQEGDLDAATEAWRSVMFRFPDNEASRRARYSIGRQLEKQGDYLRALEHYRAITGQTYRQEAAVRIHTLTTPQIQLQIDRTYLPGSRPQFKALTRNLREFELLVHRVDAKDYFNKTAQTEGLLELEIAIAAPDHRETHVVENPKDYAPIEHDLTVPYDEAGVYIVTLRSGKHETSNAVLVTDLTLLSFLSKKRAEAIALRHGQDEPLTNPTLLIATDRKHVDDLDSLDNPNRASLFLDVDGHYAFHDLSVENFAAAPDPQPIRYLITDREIYAPGDTVQATAILRSVSAQSLAVPTDKLTLRVKAPNGLPYLEREITPSQGDGTERQSFVLPDDFATGRWNVVIEDTKGMVLAQRTIAVVRPRQQDAFRVALKTVPERPELGADLKFEARVVDREGRPLRGHLLPWQVRGSIAHQEGETLSDSDGRVVVSLDGSHYLGENPTFALQTPDGESHQIVSPGQEDALSLHVSPRGLVSAPVGHERHIWIKGHLRDHPVHYEITRLYQNGTRSVVQTGTLVSDDDGEKEFAFTPQTEGQYDIRVHGEDAHGRPSYAVGTVRAVTPGEDHGLLLDLDHREVRAGESVELRVYSAFSMRGFVTVLTDRVEHQKPVSWVPGWNRITVQAPQGRWGAFEVAVWGLQERNLHGIRTKLGVKRELDVHLSWNREDYVGGESAELGVRVVDENGDPRAARVHVVISRRPEMPPLEGLFTRAWKGPYIEVDSSNRVAYGGIKRTVAQQALVAMQEFGRQQRGFAPVQGTNPFLMPELQQELDQRRDLSINFANQRVDSFANDWGLQHDPHPIPTLVSAFDLVTDSEGRVSVPVTWPAASGPWFVEAIAWDRERLGQTRETVHVEEGPTLILPAIAERGQEIQAVLIGQGTATLKAGTQSQTVSLTRGEESTVPLRIEDEGELQIEVTTDRSVLRQTLPILDRTQLSGPALSRPLAAFEAIEACAARVFLAEDGDSRLRAVREAEIAAGEASSEEETLALALALEHAKEEGIEIGTEPLASLVSRLDRALAGKPQGDARVLRRYLLSMTSELLSIQLAPYFRERERLSARANALLAILYARIERTEEHQEVLGAMERAVDAGRLHDDIGWFDSEAFARAWVTAARGNKENAGNAASSSHRPFVAGLWAHLSEATRPQERALRPMQRLGSDRLYHYPFPVVDGRRILPDHGSVQPTDDYEAPSMDAVPAGKAFRVSGEVRVSVAGWYEESLPSTCRPKTVSSPWQYDHARHRLIASLPKGLHHLDYELVALTPGGATPTVLSANASPTPEAIAEPAVTLSLALDAFAHERHEQGLSYLQSLEARASVFGEMRSRLAFEGFSAARALERRREAIGYLEALKEISPERVISRDNARFAAESYESLDEPWAAMDLYRALADELYLEEALLPGRLQAVGKKEQAMDWNEKLLSSYPGTSLNREMMIALAQRRAQSGPDQQDQAAQTYRTQLAIDSQQDGRDETAYALANLYLESSRPDLAERVAGRALILFPDSIMKPGFLLARALSLYAQEKYEEAETATDAMKETNETLATLLEAQIFHARGEWQKALDTYRQVTDQYPDARKTVAFLQRSGITVPELTVLRSDEAPGIDLEYLGVGDVEVKLYKIDLMRLYFRAGGEVSLSDIEVAGFHPLLDQKITLERPSTSARLEQRLPLEIKEAGAYYLTARSGSFTTTGLVLVSDLTMEVQPESTNVRVYVSDARENQNAPNVKVAFIHRASPVQFKLERTDLRGIAEANELSGMVSIVAEREGHFAIHRFEIAPNDFRGLGNSPSPSNALEDELRRNFLNVPDRSKFYEDNQFQTDRGIQLKRK